LIADQVTELFQDEYTAFQVEWKNYHYLLTNGEAEDDTADKDANHHNPSIDPLASTLAAAPPEGDNNKRAKNQKNKKKSIMFQFVKPILKLKGGARNVLRRRRGRGGGGSGKKQPSTTAFQTPSDIESESSNNYLPPTSSRTLTTGVSV
jgi:hypothetical protein